MPPSIWEAMSAGRSAIGPITTAPLDEAEDPYGGRDQAVAGGRLRPPPAGDDGPLQLARGHRRRRSAAPRRMSRSPPRTPAGSVPSSAPASSARRRSRTTTAGLLLERRTRADVFSVPRAMPGAPAAQVSMVHGLRGPVFGVTSACSSSNHAICLGRRPAQARPRRHHARRRHRRAAHLWHPQGLGSLARSSARHLPPVLGRP